jgi:formamidopyrimidine-DNA glycosylase
VVGDGINLRFHKVEEPRPEKHQLLIEFEDGTAISASAAMYGGIFCTPAGGHDNPYYLLAVKKPSPLTDVFSEDYFRGLFTPECEKLSVKAFLATEQRIPGLGNGVLQDILYNAGMHPKKKVSSLGEQERTTLFEVIRSILQEMTRLGGRDTERDLFGNPGGYSTKMSKNTAGKECPRCGQIILKESYMGGSVYYCPGCQPIE